MKLNSLMTGVALAASCCIATIAHAQALTVCTEASPEGFDVAQYLTASTNDATAETLFDRLVTFERGSTQVIPSLALRWDISPDGLVYTFHLRQGVKFHSTAYFKSTRTLNADDVLWTFNRMLDKNNPWYKAAARGYPYAESMALPGLIKAVEKVDPYTVRFVLNRPEAPFLADLAMGFTSIYSAEYAGQLQKTGQMDQLNQRPIGTGPFVFRRYQKDAQVRFDANPNYWGPKARVNPLIFAIVLDPSTRIEKLKANECQIALYPKTIDISHLLKDPALQVVGVKGMFTAYLALNQSHKPFDDKRVRLALNMAFDRHAFIKAVFGTGNALPGVNPYPPVLWSYNQSIKPYSYSPEKARELLKAAGYPNGFSMTLFARSDGGPSLPNPSLAAQLIQADFKKIGVNVIIRIVEWGELNQQARAGIPDAVFAGWSGDNGDPDNFLSPLLSCSAAQSGENYARWCNPAFDRLLNQATHTSDQAQRTQYYQQAQALFHEDAPWITLGYPLAYTALRKNISGYLPTPFMTNNFAQTEIK